MKDDKKNEFAAAKHRHKPFTPNKRTWKQFWKYVGDAEGRIIASERCGQCGVSIIPSRMAGYITLVYIIAAMAGCGFLYWKALHNSMNARWFAPALIFHGLSVKLVPTIYAFAAGCFHWRAYAGTDDEKAEMRIQRMKHCLRLTTLFWRAGTLLLWIAVFYIVM